MQRAETTAVFQLESRGMKELSKARPDRFEDIVALVYHLGLGLQRVWSMTLST